MAIGVTAAGAPASAADSFYSAPRGTDLGALKPGPVLKTRHLTYHVANIATPIKAVQILYRTTDSVGTPIANVTSVLLPPGRPLAGRVLSYQSAYDSLNPNDSPSRSVAGDVQLGGLTRGSNQGIGGSFVASETTLFGPMLAAGYTINLPDTEGPTANFAAGPQYGKNTLDSLRVAKQVAGTGVTDTSRIGLYGYSGGAIGTNWTAIEAPTYAPDINRQLIGAAEGGVLVNPANNLRYVSGSPVWSGVAGMAVVGIAKSFNVSFDKYLNDFGRHTIARLNDASIINVLGQYGRLTWRQLVKPQYANPNSVPEYVDVANKINMGTAPTPTIPMFVAQGSNGILEGTPPGPAGIGRGDGVMIAGDVRTLMRNYCSAGLDIHYDEYTALSHIPSTLAWLPGALQWLTDRFDNRPAPNNCTTIQPGNSLAPQQHAPTS